VRKELQFWIVTSNTSRKSPFRVRRTVRVAGHCVIVIALSYDCEGDSFVLIWSILAKSCCAGL
jgi:hypothetical protein